MANFYTPYEGGTFESSFQVPFQFNGSQTPSGIVNCGTFDVSSEHVLQGTKSGRLTIINDAVVNSGYKYAVSAFSFRARPSTGQFNIISLVSDLKYELRLSVKTLSSNPFANDDAILFLAGDESNIPQTSNNVSIQDLGSGRYKMSVTSLSTGAVLYETWGWKVSAIKDTLRELVYNWVEPSSSPANIQYAQPKLLVVLKNPASGLFPITGTQNLLVGGKLYFDLANLDYAAQNCTIAFGNPAFSKTDETSLAANNGTITVFATGQGTLQYKLDSGAYQFSNVFTGVAVGAHTITVKDSSACTPISTNVTILAFNDTTPPPSTSGVLTINEQPITLGNFISWFSASGGIGFTSVECENHYWDLPKTYRLNKKSMQHSAVVVNNEEFSFYVNFQTPINNPNFTNLKLALINNSGNVQLNIAALQKDLFADAVRYNIYANVILSGVIEGVYRLAIYDNSTGSILYVSSTIELISLEEAKMKTCRIIHRNSFDVFNTYYSRVLNYLNKIRLRMSTEAQPELTIQQYRSASSGKIRNYSFEADKEVKFETYFFDDNAIEGMYVFQICDTININNKNYILKESYKTNWNASLNCNKGTITMYEQEFSTANRYGVAGNITIVGSEDPLLLGDNGGRIKI